MSVKIEEIKRRVLDKYSFFGTIMDTVKYIETRNCVDFNGNPTAATNGSVVYYHPDFMENITENQQVFVLAHEISHIAFEHIERGKGKDPEIWNRATDAVSNAHLKKNGLELVKGAVDIPWAIYYDAETMYEKLLKRKNRRKKKETKNENKDVGHDTHRFWNENELIPKSEIIKEVQRQLVEMGEKEVFQKKDKNNIKKILEKTKASLERLSKKETNGLGSGTGNTTLSEKGQFEDVGFHDSLINWPLILKKPIEIVKLDWSYQNAYIEDGVVSASLEESSYLEFYETEILLDTSGSISDELLRTFLRECKNILNFSKMKVGCFDEVFYGFQEIKSMKDIDEFTFIGRGGTNFSAAVKAFSEKADNKIIFTDGEAFMPNEKHDIIWVVFGDNKINPIGGTVIYIDKEKLLNLSQKEKQLLFRK